MKTKFNVDDLERLLAAQESPFCGYEVALKEIQRGKKRSHWIWYIFPMLRALGRSSRAYYYGIADSCEAKRLLSDRVLESRLREITRALLTHRELSPVEIFGDIDSEKVRSSMTMFDFVSPGDIFGEVLDSFYNGERCQTTLKIMQQE